MKMTYLFLFLGVMALCLFTVSVVFWGRRRRKEKSPVFSTFVSYAHEDASIARLLAAELSYMYFRTFIDQKGLTIGDPLTDKVRRSIAQSNSITLLLSPASAASDWVKQEVRWARQMGRQIYPIEVSSIKEDTLPAELRDVIRVDAASNLAPALKSLFKLVHDPNGALDSINLLLMEKPLDLFHGFQIVAMVAESLMRNSRNQITIPRIDFDNCYLWSGTLFQRGDTVQECFVLPPNSELTGPSDRPAAAGSGPGSAIQPLEVIGSIALKLLEHSARTQINLQEHPAASFNKLSPKYSPVDHARLMNFVGMVYDLTGHVPAQQIRSLDELVLLTHYIDSPAPAFATMFGGVKVSAGSTKKSSLSVVLISSKGNRTLDICLTALSRQTLKPDEIVVVEDVSSRRSARTLAKWKVRHAVLPPPLESRRYGRRAACRRLGTDLARGNVLLYLDGDTIPAPRVVEMVLETWKKFGGSPNESFSVMIPSLDVDPRKTGYDYDAIMKEILIKTETKDGPEKEDVLREQREREAERQKMTAAVRPYGGGRAGLSSWIQKDVKHMEKQDDVRWNEIRSRCWGVSDEDVQKANSWDADFVGYGEEDIELAYRLCQTCRTRFRILHLADVVAAHVTHKIDHRRRDREWARNGALLITKHPELRKERTEFFRRMGLEHLLMQELGKVEAGHRS